jgi:hypothetical protein
MYRIINSSVRLKRKTAAMMTRIVQQAVELAAKAIQESRKKGYLNFLVYGDKRIRT